MFSHTQNQEVPLPSGTVVKRPPFSAWNTLWTLAWLRMCTVLCWPPWIIAGFAVVISVVNYGFHAPIMFVMNIEQQTLYADWRNVRHYSNMIINDHQQVGL